MKKLKKPIETGYVNRGIFSLCFSQLFIIIGIIIFFHPVIVIPLLIISLFLIRALIIAFKYFLSVEECYYNNGKFYYRKILFNKFLLNKIELPILEIKEIKDRGKKILRKADKMWTVIYYIYYFKIYERVYIEMNNGEKYYIWNYVKSPSLSSIYDNTYDNDDEFLNSFKEIKNMLLEGQKDKILKIELNELNKIYNDSFNKRYKYILEKIILEEKIFTYKLSNKLIINGDSKVIKNLEIFKNMNFEEINFYVFYVNYLSKKEYEDQKVLVGYNGIDGKEVTMLKLKEDINEIRDSKNSFK